MKSKQDPQDWERLRHGRDRHLGFAVGRYLQPAPMLFTRDGHNVFLGDLYRGRAAFLICSGPSLKQHDLSRLNARGLLTMAVNNAAVVQRPHLWCSVDDPGNFCDAIWKDPAVMKFVPLCHMEKPVLVRDADERLVPSAERVGDMPAVFGYRRNETFDAERWLHEETFNWGCHGKQVDAYGNKGSRSVMYVALRLLFYLGVRRVFLLGCDFRMQTGWDNYAFEQDRSAGSIRGNNTSYRILNDRLRRLKPHFEREGFEVANCTPDSGLTVFPHVPFEEALAAARTGMPETILTAGMYDRKQRERDAKTTKTNGAIPRKSPAQKTETGRVLKNLTLITAVDERHAPRLQQTWQTWMALKPELRDVPAIVIHDARFEPRGSVLEALQEHPRLRFVPWEMPQAETQRERMLTALVQVAARKVRTAWYLKLDSDVVATRPGPWLDDSWFDVDPETGPPAFVSSPWGYTKPADAIRRLDDWGDRVPGLKDRPRLDLPFDPQSGLVRHPRIISWCFFGNTQWTREVAAYAPGRLPVPSHDTYLHYCAARRGDPFVRVTMKQFGWEHVSGFRRLKRRCRDVLTG